MPSSYRGEIFLYRTQILPIGPRWSRKNFSPVGGFLVLAGSDIHFDMQCAHPFLSFTPRRRPLLFRCCQFLLAQAFVFFPSLLPPFLPSLLPSSIVVAAAAVGSAKSLSQIQRMKNGWEARTRRPSCAHARFLSTCSAHVASVSALHSGSCDHAA